MQVLARRPLVRGAVTAARSTFPRPSHTSTVRWMSSDSFKLSQNFIEKFKDEVRQLRQRAV